MPDAENSLAMSRSQQSRLQPLPSQVDIMRNLSKSQCQKIRPQSLLGVRTPRQDSPDLTVSLIDLTDDFHKSRHGSKLPRRDQNRSLVNSIISIVGRSDAEQSLPDDA